jgi:PIN domain nuclease of toxin-antitoxin system
VTLLDTHALIWWVNGAPALSARARRTLAAASRTQPALVSAISVFEIATALRRGRLALGRPIERWLDDVASLPEIRMIPVTREIARMAGGFDASVHGDPADRIIAATALSLDAALVSADARLRSVPRLNVIW